jgi:hypothetical protein
VLSRTPARHRRLGAAVALATLAAIVALPVRPTGAATSLPTLRPGGPPPGTWIAGDTHVHDDHSADGSFVRQTVSQEGPGDLSVGDQIGQAERTGLGFLALTDHRTYDQQWDPQWSSNKLLLVPGEEADGSPHATVLGAADELVDGANPPGSAAFRHIQQSVWDVHAQDGSWGTAHPDDGETNSDGTPNANASTIGVDTIEVWNKASDVDAEIAYTENRWNHGWRTGVAGASDDHFREVWAIAGPGQPTTWVYASTPTSRGVVDGLRAGHTTVSSNPLGPIVTTDLLDGTGRWMAMTGDEVAAPAGAKGTLRIRAQRALGDMVTVYAAPGRSAGPIATLPVTTENQTFLVPVTMGPAWYRAEVRGVGSPPGLTDLESFVTGATPVTNPTAIANQLLAIASPVFVTTSGSPAVATAEIPLPAAEVTSDPVPARPAIAQLGRFSGFPDVATSGEAVHLVAEQQVDGRSHVLYKRADGDADAVDLTPDSPSARFPAVAARGHDVWVVWQDERGGEMPHRPRIFLRHSGNDGRTWGASQAVTAGEGEAQHPDVTVSVSGHPVVAWSDNRTGPFDVLVQEVGVDRGPVDVAAPGKTVTPGTPADSRSALYPASLFPVLAAAPDGRLALAWTDDRTDVDPLWTGHLGGTGTDPDNWEILVARRNPGGRWSQPVDASASPTLADRHPALAFAGDGSLVAAWDAKPLQSSGANPALRWSRSSDGGTTFAPPATFAQAPDAMSEQPSLATGTDGVVRAVWYDSRSADWRWSVWSASLSAGGWAAPVRISGPGNATYPALSGDVVAFTSDRNARSQRDRTEEVYAAWLH